MSAVNPRWPDPPVQELVVSMCDQLAMSARFVAALMLGLLAASCATNEAADVTASPTSSLDSAAHSDTGTPSTTPATTAPSTTAPSTTAPSTTTPRLPLVIQGVGDTNLDPAYIPTFRQEGYDHAFNGLDNIFAEDDLTVANLECTPSSVGEALPRPFNFRCDPAALPSMTRHSIEVANLANNHAMDYGGDALVDGIANVQAAGMLGVGVGANRHDAFAPVVYETDGWSIAVVGFGAVYLAIDWLATDTQPGISDGLDIEQMVETVSAAAAEHDLVVVGVHWCCELETTPNARNRAHAEALVEAGADVIFGHHHHRLQPMEMIDGAAVFWGLGNFVWPRLSVAGSDTAIGRVEMAADGTVTAACLLPVTIESHGHPTLDDPSIRDCSATAANTSTAPGTGAG